MSSFSKVLKAFHKDTQYLPVPYPILPALAVDSRKPTPEQIRKCREDFEAYEKNFYATIAEIDARFEAGLTRIKVCTFLNGFLNPLSQTPINERAHFKWCPHDEWMEHARPHLRLDTDPSHQFS
jgi:hypothetical protein